MSSNIRDTSRHRSPQGHQKSHYSSKHPASNQPTKQAFVPALNVNVNINVAQSQTFNMDKMIWQAANSNQNSPRLPGVNEMAAHANRQMQQPEFGGQSPRMR
jgi:hypothetical protein